MAGKTGLCGLGSPARIGPAMRSLALAFGFLVTDREPESLRGATLFQLGPVGADHISRKCIAPRFVPFSSGQQRDVADEFFDVDGLG